MSPAIDHIPSAACGATVDQRGLPRPRGGTTGVASCDVGAIEVKACAASRGHRSAGGRPRAGDPLDLADAWRAPTAARWRDLADARPAPRRRADASSSSWLRWFEDGDRFVELSTDRLDAHRRRRASFQPRLRARRGARRRRSADGPESPEVTLHLPLLATRADEAVGDGGGVGRPTTRAGTSR